MLISKITSDHVDQEVVLKGRIVHIRFSGKIWFVEFRDGSGFVQCIIEKKVIGDDAFEEIKSCGIETALEIIWNISKHPKKDEFELQTTAIKIITKTNDYPLGQKEHGPDFLFEQRHLHLRTKKQRAIQRIRDTIIHATYDWMRDNDYTKTDSPIFTPNACEDSTELYEVKHVNGEKMFLNQSGQLYIEATIMWHGRVFDFGPAFRAEHCKTRRHLNELWMMDAETAFCDNNQNMEIQEKLIFFIIQEVLKRNKKEFEILERDSSKLEKIQLPFARKKHAEIVKELQEMGSDIKDGEDLGADDEEMLMNKYEQPIFVTNYPKDVKAFYMPEDPEEPGTVKCSDLLAPEWNGEVIGWSERISDYDTLKAKILEQGFDLKDRNWYLDTKKYGGVTNSWFGIGLERLVRWICNLHHIRETIPFPRYGNRIRP